MVFRDLMAKTWSVLTMPLGRRRTQSTSGRFGTSAIDGWRGGAIGLDARRDAGSWLDIYNRNSRVRGPVSRIAQDVGSVSWTLKRVGGERADGTASYDIVREHPLLALWEQPNPDMTGQEFRELITVYVEMCGLAPVWIERDREDRRRTEDGFGVRPKWLWPIRPQDLLQEPSKSDPRWRFKVGDQVVHCRLQDMVLIRQINPLSPYKGGIGSAEAIASEVTQDELSGRWNANIYRNGSRIGHTISVPGIPPDKMRELQEWYEKNQSGVDNSHKDLFLNADVKVQALGTAHRDLDFLEGRRLLRDTQRQNWTIPGEILGITENSNRATADAALNIHQRLNVRPRVARMESWVNQRIVPLYGEPDLVLVADNPVQESADALHRYMTDGLVRGCVTVDEWREAHGMKPLGGEQGSRLYVPLNIAQVEAQEQSMGVGGTGGQAAAEAPPSLLTLTGRTP